jgi:hypothetical protein
MRGDDALRSLGLTPPDLMKVDIDGYEVEVLKGMMAILGRAALLSIIVEAQKDRTECKVMKLLSARDSQGRAKPEMMGSTFDGLSRRAD